MASHLIVPRRQRDASQLTKVLDILFPGRSLLERVSHYLNMAGLGKKRAFGLEDFVNSEQGDQYRRQVLAAQRHRKAFPRPPVPPGNEGDPVWHRLCDVASLFGLVQSRLHKCRSCHRWYFAGPGHRGRYCPDCFQANTISKNRQISLEALRQVLNKESEAAIRNPARLAARSCYSTLACRGPRFYPGP